jgi:flavin-dependent dehydrogenase
VRSSALSLFPAAGGTLGVVVGAALARRGRKVAVLERGPLKGRAQDWNLSRVELEALVREGVMTPAERDAAITAEFNPGRCAFHGHGGVEVKDVLNLGVSPDVVVTAARRALEAAGGVVIENTGCDALDVYDNGCRLALAGAGAPPGPELTARLALDCMGHASPAVRQARWGRRPDGVCLVVGSCARGFDAAANVGGDVIATVGPMERGEDGLAQQLFWEAFPAGSGPSDRTTYMFTYADADPARPSLASMLERYFELLPAYQGVASVEELELQRVLFGCFPTYRDSPLRPSWDRVLAVGDASGIQSPLSFGGFGALSRHLGRVAAAVDDALEADCLDRGALAAINPYTPNLAGAWLFQRAMSAPRGTNPDPQFVNTLLGTNFGVMNRLGDGVLRPFLQDVPQFGALSATLAGMMLSKPLLIPPILIHVGPGPLITWVRHYAAMGLYTLLWLLASPVAPALRKAPLPPRAAFLLRRALDAWQFGSGLDYELPESRTP